MAAFRRDEQRPIVWVEDSAAYRLILKNAIVQLKAEFDVLPEIVWKHTAEDTVDWLNRLEQQDDLEMPLLMFLDVRLPGMSGLQFLGNLKAAQGWSSIPVIMFSTSISPLDVKEAYKHGAAGYLQKPNAFEKLVEILRITLRYYERNELPPLETLRRLTGHPTPPST